MRYNIDDVIEFKDGEYLILDVINHNDNSYLYLINNNEYMDDVSIVKVLDNNELGYIESDSEFNYVINKIFIDCEKDLLSFVSEEN